jgi:ribosomal protein L7/L12
MSYQQLDRIEKMLVALTAQAQPRTSEHTMKDLFRFMRNGMKLDAIRTYRQITGATLKDSKDAIESLMDMFKDSP